MNRCKDCKWWGDLDPNGQPGWRKCILHACRCHYLSVCTDFTPKDGEA